MNVVSVQPLRVLRGPFFRAQPWRVSLVAITCIGSLFVAAFLLGGATRSVGLMPSIWPTNAVLLGVLLRWPALATPVGWTVVLFGLVLDNLVSGSSPANALLHAGADFAGIVTGYLLFARLDAADRALRHPMSVLHLVVNSVTASAAAVLVGFTAHSIVFDNPPVGNASLWVTTQFVNYITVLPVMLTWPVISWRKLLDRRRGPRAGGMDAQRIIPMLALAVSCAAGLFVGGPGAVAFPVPALLWCALTYSLFSTASLTLLFSVWTLAAISLGYIVVPTEDESLHTMTSIRLGVALMAIAPITVASVMAARNQLLIGLQHLATHDPLTDLLNRRAFTDTTAGQLKSAARLNQPVAVLMIDVDHFKSINDTYGHSAGDQVLARLATALRGSLREEDVVGRLGGEEFAVFLSGATREEAALVAERVRLAFATAIVDLYDGRRVTSTVSIGVSADKHPPLTIEPLLAAADKALYAAKTSGRNRVVIAGDGGSIGATCRPDIALL